MILITARRPIMRKLPPGSICLLSVAACLPGAPLCGTEARARAQPARIRPDNDESALLMSLDELHPGRGYQEIALMHQRERWRSPYYWAGFILQGGGNNK